MKPNPGDGQCQDEEHGNAGRVPHAAMMSIGHRFILGCKTLHSLECLSLSGRRPYRFLRYACAAYLRQESTANRLSSAESRVCPCSDAMLRRPTSAVNLLMTLAADGYPEDRDEAAAVAGDGSACGRDREWPAPGLRNQDCPTPAPHGGPG
jgi:hypothetical protein